MSNDSEFQEVIRSSFWLFVGVAIFNIVGFLYWIIISLFVSPDAVGTASAILSLESLLINIFSLGIPIGIRRFIGKYWSKKESKKISSHLSVSLTLSILIFTPVIITILFLSIQNTTLLNLGQMELFVTVVLIFLDFWPGVLASFFISIFRTKITTLSNSASSIVKIVTGVFFLQLGFGLEAILLGMIFASISRGVILLGYSSKISTEIGVKIRPRIEKQVMSNILLAGTASWIPNTLLVVGQTLGVLLIYGYVGSAETGLYFVAFAISSALYHLPGSIQSMMFPMLSGMENYREEIVLKSIRLSLAIIVPIALILMIYPGLPFVFLGFQYAGASEILAVLMFGLIAYPIVSGYSTYIYALGKYLHVVMIDMLSTAIRLIFYWLLIIQYQGLGAAIAYTLGIFASIIPVLISSNRIGFSFESIPYLKIFTVPIILSLLGLSFHFPWIIELFLILIITFVFYTRTGVITKNDLKQMALAFLSAESVAKVHTHTKRIVMFLFGD
ncbi:MAG: oligosaccharide flippase family protein [Candidatus Thorarchaeota archaeon]